MTKFVMTISMVMTMAAGVSLRAETVECPAVEGQVLAEAGVYSGPIANGEGRIPDVIKASAKPRKLLNVWKLFPLPAGATPDDSRWFLQCLYVPPSLADADVGEAQMKVQRIIKLPESISECRSEGYPLRTSCK